MGERLVMAIRDGKKTIWVYHHYAGAVLSWVGLIAETQLKKEPKTADDWLKALKEADSEFIVTDEPEREDKNYLALIDIENKRALWLPLSQVYMFYGDNHLKVHLFAESFIKLASLGVHFVFPLVSQFDFKVLYLDSPRSLINEWEKTLNRIEAFFKERYGDKKTGTFLDAYLEAFEKERKTIEEFKATVRW